MYAEKRDFYGKRLTGEGDVAWKVAGNLGNPQLAVIEII
jgi:hypothetical protein